MPRFEFSRADRTVLWQHGFGGVESALRWAAVELQLFFLSRSPDLVQDGDDGARHYANFLAWCDSALGGIDRGVKKSGDFELLRRWHDLTDHPVRKLMRDARNEALKARREVVGDEFAADLGDGGFLTAHRFGAALGEGWEDAPVYGTSRDYLFWIQNAALPLLFEAVQLGTVGIDDRDIGEMPFPDADPWTCDLAFDLQSILRWPDLE